jgi:hypothetical protein
LTLGAQGWAPVDLLTIDDDRPQLLSVGQTDDRRHDFGDAWDMRQVHPTEGTLDAVECPTQSFWPRTDLEIRSSAFRLDPDCELSEALCPETGVSGDGTMYRGVVELAHRLFLASTGDG